MMCFRKVINSFCMTINNHPIKYMDDYYKETYYVVLKNLLGNMTKEENIIFELYLKIFNIDTKKISIDYKTAKKTVKKLHRLYLNDGKVKFVSHYFKYILICDFYWIKRCKIDEIGKRKLVKDIKIKEKEFNIISKLLLLLNDNNIQLANKYKNMYLKNIKYIYLFYYLEQFSNLKSNIERRKKNIAVVATMSAGKSTLMNVLIGKNLFPSQNQACTAKITKFEYFSNLDHVIGVGVKKNGDVVYESCVTDKTLNLWNEDDNVESINLKGNIDWINKNCKCNICLFDTPGTNFSQDISHKRATLKFLKNNSIDLLLYIINATQIASDDDNNLMKTISGVVENTNTKIIFLLNKVDLFDIESGDSIKTSLELLKSNIRNNGIENFEILPISAYGAEIFNYAIKGEQLSKNKRRKLKYFLDVFNDEAFNLIKYSSSKYNNFNNYNQENELLKSLKKTNLPTLQSILVEYTN